MTAKEVTSSIRALIGDLDSDKWSSPQILDALNNARTELVRQTGVLKTTGTLIINPDERVYKLPTDCFYVLRAVYQEENIPFISMERLDETNPSWFAEAASDKLKYLVYDNLNQDEIMTYPLLSSNNKAYDIEGTDGPIVDIEDLDKSTLYGGITDIQDDVPFRKTREDNYGVLTDIVNPFLEIKIYYVKKPTPLIGPGQDIEIDSIYKMYLVYKAAAELLSYDNNADNVNKSMLFDKKALYYIQDVKNNDISSIVPDESIVFSYRGAFDE